MGYNAGKEEPLVEAWEKALNNHEKECERRYGEVLAKLAHLDGKFSIFMWVLGYLAALMSIITVRVLIS